MYIHIIIFILEVCRKVKKLIKCLPVNKYLGWNIHSVILWNQDGTGVNNFV